MAKEITSDFLRVGNAIVDTVEQEWTSRITNETPEIIKGLAEAKRRLKAEHVIASRPAIACDFIGDDITNNIKGALSDVGLGNSLLEDFLEDFIDGLSLVINSVYIGQREIEGKTQEDFEVTKERIQTQLEKEGLTPSVEVASIDSYQSVAEFAAQSLIKDPTALTLVDKICEDLTGEGKFVSPRGAKLSPELLIRGTYFGKTMYKQLYPLTENLPQV